MSAFTAQSRSALPEFVRAYYEQLRVDYESSGVRVAAPASESPAWQDLYRLEIALLRTRDENELRRSAWIVRMRFRNVCGEASYQEYLNSLPPDPSNAPKDVLLADLLNLVRRTYYVTVLSPNGDQTRQHLLIWAGGLGVAIIIIIALLAWKPILDPDILYLVLLAGAAGGTMSLIHRIQSVPDADPILYGLGSRALMVQTVLIPPVSGMIFAVVLYMIFAGHIIKGPFVPDFTEAKPAGIGVRFFEFFTQTQAVTSTAFALMLVWAFVAGFAERFVPNALSRLTSQRSDSRTDT